MPLYPHQIKAVELLYDYLKGNPTGNPCLEMPTGSGKSHVIAHICKDWLSNYPYLRILMLTHKKELIEQNYSKLRDIWPNAPIGIYSASIGKKNLEESITFASIQSIGKKAKETGHVDIVIIDECHLISHKDEGTYRTFLKSLHEINPYIRIIGLTATPFRLGHGYITDKPAIFDDILKPTNILELMQGGFLSMLRSRPMDFEVNTDDVKIRGGDYVESELEKAFDKDDINLKAVQEVIAKADGRKSWLFFCSGVKHAHHIHDILTSHGIKSALVLGDTPKSEREKAIIDFKNFEITAIVNVDTLTTGFDAPNTDLLVFLRKTLSPSLYIQMAGRGTRLKQHTDHCMVMDFAGNIRIHGAITNVLPPDKNGKLDKKGEPPIKECPQCSEFVPASCRKCNICGYEFPIVEKEFKLHDDDIMGLKGSRREIKEWAFRLHTSANSNKEMIKCTYYSDSFTSDKIDEYFCIYHDGYAGQKARKRLFELSMKAGAILDGLVTNEEILEELNKSKPPKWVEVLKEGKFYKVTDIYFDYSA